MPHREPDAHDAPRPDADTPAGGYDARDHYCPADETRADAPPAKRDAENLLLWMAGGIRAGDADV